MRAHLVQLFARAPAVGAVKTRLAATLGAERACELYRAMGAQVVAQLVEGERAYDLCVRYTPDDAGEAVRAWLGALGPGAADEIVWEPQGAGDLGARLAASVSAAFARGYQSVTLVGTDCLGLTSARVREALRALDGCDAALGPAHDGGYYLLSLRRELPVFEGVAWGTETVAESTRAALRAAGAAWIELPTERDIDTEDDLLAVGASLL